MKKLFILSILLFCFICLDKSVNAATGHDAFTSITFNKKGKLLIDMTEEEIEVGYKHAGKKTFMGSRTHYFTLQEEANYIAEVIFAKSNRTSQPFTIDYTLQEKKYNEDSFKINGSIGGSIKGKVKSANVEGKAEAGVESESTDSLTRVEETKFKAVIQPNHRLVFHVTGDCIVTNGVSVNFIFWMKSTKGSFESITVTTRYYELLEEEIK